MTNISIKQTTPHISIRASGKQGPQGGKGDTGATGPQGPKGDPGTTDYNQLENLPDLTLKADKATTYTKTEVDTALTGKADTVHTHVASDVTDFDSEVSSNSDVSANTAARHTHANKAILDATSASFTTANKTKLDGIETGAEVNTVTSVAGKTGAVTLDKTDVGLSNVDNTSDANKPVSTAQAAADSLLIKSEKNPIIKPITTFASGHGFVKNTANGTQTDDTADGYKDSHSMSLTSPGNGVNTVVTSKKTIPVVDLTGKLPVIAVKIENLASLSALTFYFSSDNMASSWYALSPTHDPGQLKEGAWIPLSLSFGRAIASGTPDRSNINTIQIRVQDTGSPVTVKFGLVGYTDEPTSGVCSITFDDGRISQYTKARAKMDEYGMPGTAYINSSTVGTSSKVTIDQLRQMQDNSGWDISAHTHTHPQLSNNSTPQEVEDELRLNKDWLIANGFYKGADHLAYPHGNYDYTKVIPIVKKYYASARSVVTYPESSMIINPYVLRGHYVLNTTTLDSLKATVSRAIANKEWALFTFHSIVDNPLVAEDFSTTTFGEFIDWLATQDIEVRPVSEVVKQRTPSKYQVGLSNVDNTSDVNKPVSTAMQTALNAKANTSDTVNLTGNQTIAGVKTFTSAPIAPSGASIGGVLYLTGTGFPNGVVAAPVGSIYIDTTVTNGASSWIKKSGTGNTGWQVLEGDTGWRNITSLLINGWTATHVRVRRVGDRVFYGFENLSASTMTDTSPIAPPSGFRFTGAGIYSERQFLATAANPAQVWRVTTNGTAMSVQGATTALASLYGSLSFITNDPYPTTLPGTAV